MIKHIPDEVGSQVKGARRVVVVYESNATREHAVSFCEQLAGQHRAAAELEVEWCPFVHLTEAEQAEAATQKATEADYVVFAVCSGDDLPQEVKAWLEKWLARRAEHEGVFVGLVDRQENPCDMACLKEIYLRQVAHRAGMDYLAHMPPTAVRVMPDSLDSFSERAGQMTSLLDEILHARPLPAPPVSSL